MDLQSEIARLVIEKGGSIVQANPEEEGSENITSILIDDKVYKISIEGIGDLERRIETVETDKADELTMNTGINISDWDRDIDPDVPVIVDKYTNYHDAVSKISQQIDVMGNRTDDLKTSLNDNYYNKTEINSINLNMFRQFCFQPFSIDNGSSGNMEIKIGGNLSYSRNEAVNILLSTRYGVCILRIQFDSQDVASSSVTQLAGTVAISNISASKASNNLVITFTTNSWSHITGFIDLCCTEMYLISAKRV